MIKMMLRQFGNGLMELFQTTKLGLTIGRKTIIKEEKMRIYILTELGTVMRNEITEDMSLNFHQQFLMLIQ